MQTFENIYASLRGDKSIWLIVVMLGLFSILAVYSATGSIAFSKRGGNTEYFLIQQVIFIALGFVVTYICYQLHYMQYSKLAPMLMLITIPLLFYTIMWGVDINSARRWISMPILDKTIQTSDFAKIALIMYVARALAKKQDVIKGFNDAFLPIIFPIVIVCALIAPADLSTSALLFATCLLMMFIGRVSMKYIGLLALIGIVALSIIVLIGTQFPELVRLETWMNRIDQFLYSEGEFQVVESKIAIANGGWFGAGPGNSVQKNFVPYAYADSIYAIICEEYGLLGGIGIIGLYLWLLVRCITIVTKCPKTFGAILAMGLCLNIVIQAFANIAVSLHLVPVTGLTLPLISMGGTSVLFTCMSLGIILSISKYVEEAHYRELNLQQIEVQDADSI